MLYEKSRIKEEREQRETELARVTPNTRPVVIDDLCIESQLQEREDSAAKVKDDVENGKAARGLSRIIEKDLGPVLDECDDKLDVRAGIDKVQPLEVPHAAVAISVDADEQKGHEERSDQGSCKVHGPSADLLTGRATEEDRLTNLPRGKDERMYSKEGVIPPNDILATTVALSILVLHSRRKQKGEVEDGVGGESQDVKVEEIERHARYRLAALHEDGLGPKGSGPEQEVGPAEKPRDSLGQNMAIFLRLSR